MTAIERLINLVIDWIEGDDDAKPPTAGELRAAQRLIDTIQRKHERIENAAADKAADDFRAKDTDPGIILP